MCLSEFFPTIIVQTSDLSIRDFVLFVGRSAAGSQQSGNCYNKLYEKKGEVTYH